MTQRSRSALIVLTVAIGFAAAPAAARAGSGFVVPSRNTTCGILTAKQAGSDRAGLFCQSSYIPSGPHDAMGAAKLNRTGSGRKLSVGNDTALFIEGHNSDGTDDKRPVLRYGKTWTSGGYRCVSRSTGLTCRRGSHGFSLSREAQRYF